MVIREEEQSTIERQIINAKLETLSLIGRNEIIPEHYW